MPAEGNRAGTARDLQLNMCLAAAIVGSIISLADAAPLPTAPLPFERWSVGSDPHSTWSSVPVFPHPSMDGGTRTVTGSKA